MEEKKTIKISLTMFFLILAMIVICIISYFLIIFYSKKAQLETEVVRLNSENKDLVNKISETSANSTNTEKEDIEEQVTTSDVKEYSYENIKGLYSFVETDKNSIDTFYHLYLYENGTFRYEYGIEYPNSIIGNYIIIGNTLILNKMFKGGSSTDLSTTSGEIKLEINADDTITDKNELISDIIADNVTNVNLNNVILKKAPTQEEKEYVKSYPNIMTDINNSVKNKSLFNN